MAHSIILCILSFHTYRCLKQRYMLKHLCLVKPPQFPRTYIYVCITSVGEEIHRDIDGMCLHASAKKVCQHLLSFLCYIRYFHRHLTVACSLIAYIGTLPLLRFFYEGESIIHIVSFTSSFLNNADSIILILTFVLFLRLFS